MKSSTTTYFLLIAIVLARWIGTGKLQKLIAAVTGA